MLKGPENKIFVGNSLKFLRSMASEIVDSCMNDPMYMVASVKGKNCTYSWGVEPGTGLADEWWEYHKEIYEECRRVLKPGGTMCWAMGCKFMPHFRRWFGDYRIWGFSRFFIRGVNAYGHIWVVQTREQTPIRFPDDHAALLIGPRGWWSKLHPCPKSEEEMRFLVRHLTQPGQIVLDCFAGTGTTLVAAKQLGRSYIGCDLSKLYCQIAMKRLAEVQVSELSLTGPDVLGRTTTDVPVLTSHYSNNDGLMAQVARLYLRPGDRIADVTYGTGHFWRQIDLAQYDFHASDLLTVPERPCDFRCLPYKSEEFDVHVFDPPYIHHPSGFYEGYKNADTTSGYSHNDIMQLYRQGMAEGHRILKRKGLMLVKCMDEIESGRQRMSHIEIHDIAVNELSMTVKDLFILTRRSPVPYSGLVYQHARKNHSYLWVFMK